MNLRLGIALGAQLALFGALNLFDDWTLEMMPIKFVTAAILCGLAYLVAATEFAGGELGALWMFWVGTVALRLLALPLTPASELWRYQADGALQRAGVNPYRTSPLEAASIAAVPNVAQVPRNTEPTSYSPGAEILFGAIPRTYSAFVAKVIFGMADLLVVILLFRLVDLRTVVWYAWNPLIAYSFFGAAHFDSIVLLSIVAMLVCLTKFEECATSRRRWTCAACVALALAIAISIRPVMIVLLLPALFALRRYGLVLLLALVVPIGSGALFAGIGSWNLFGDFPQIGRLNDLFWWVIEDTMWPNWHQQHYRYDAVIAIVSIAFALVFARNWRRGMLWSLGSAVVLAPVLHPWYLTWILPIATWRRAFVWHFLSVTIFAYYLFFNPRLFALPWRAEPWMRGMIILPVLFAIAMLVRQRLSSRRPT